MGLPPTAKRVALHTSVSANQEILRAALGRIRQLDDAEPRALCERLQALDREWDTERVLETNAAALILTGLLLGRLADRRWRLLSLGVSAFLLQHALQGWCPPLPFIRALGVRTAQEIALEKGEVRARLDAAASTADFFPDRGWFYDHATNMSHSQT